MNSAPQDRRYHVFGRALPQAFRLSQLRIGRQRGPYDMQRLLDTDPDVVSESCVALCINPETLSSQIARCGDNGSSTATGLDQSSDFKFSVGPRNCVEFYCEYYLPGSRTVVREPSKDRA